MMDSPETPARPPRPSKTPSWVLLGFAIGALFVWALPHAPRIERVSPKTQTVVLERPKFTDIEAVFSEWGRDAVWENDLTEVALWDVEKKSYTLFYEVLRNGETYYFRSISRLTRPVLTHGVPKNSPLLLTEPEAKRREWLGRDGGSANEWSNATATPADAR